jgi:hypothetical protein
MMTCRIRLLLAVLAPAVCGILLSDGGNAADGAGRLGREGACSSGRTRHDGPVIARHTHGSSAEMTESL